MYEFILNESSVPEISDGKSDGKPEKKRRAALSGPLNPRHRAIAQRKLEEARELAKNLAATVDALAIAYEEAVSAQEEEEKDAHEAAGAEAAVAAALVAAAESEDALIENPPALVAKLSPPLIDDAKVYRLQEARARRLIQASATRR